MYLVTAIHLAPTGRGRAGSATIDAQLRDIAKLYITSPQAPAAWYERSLVYKMLTQGEVIRVGPTDGPPLMPARGSDGEPFVRSAPLYSCFDHLLCLPRM